MATKFEAGIIYAYNNPLGVEKVLIKRRTPKWVWIYVGNDRTCERKHKIYEDDRGEYIMLDRFGSYVYSYYPY